MTRPIAVPHLHVTTIFSLTGRVNIEAFSSAASNFPVGNTPRLLQRSVALPNLDVAAVVPLAVGMHVQALASTSDDFIATQKPCLLA